MMTPLDDTALEALLKDDAHTADAGFTDRVMGRLPRRRRALGRRELILSSSALLAALTGALAWSGLGVVTVELARSQWTAGAALAMAVGLGLWGALGAASSEA